MSTFQQRRMRRFPGERGLRQRLRLAGDLYARLPAERRAEAVWIWAGTDGKVHSLGRLAEYRIGRSPESSIHLDHPTVSRVHARAWWDGERCFIEDLNSTHGIRVNGKPVEHAPLHNGDVVQMGSGCVVYLGESTAR